MVEKSHSEFWDFNLFTKSLHVTLTFNVNSYTYCLHLHEEQGMYTREGNPIDMVLYTNTGQSQQSVIKQTEHNYVN